MQKALLKALRKTTSGSATIAAENLKNLRPSLTREEREAEFQLREEGRSLNEGLLGEDWRDLIETATTKYGVWDGKILFFERESSDCRWGKGKAVQKPQQNQGNDQISEKTGKAGQTQGKRR